MNLTRCSNGHFYDKDKFDSCPHCQNAGAGPSDRTQPMAAPGGGVTMPLDGGAGDVTMPVGSIGTAAPTPPPVPTPPPAATPTAPTVPLNAGGNIAAETPTEPIGGKDPIQHYDRPIEPVKIDPTDNQTSLSELVGIAMTTTSAASEKTIGIYSSMNSGSTASNDAPADPVVGWLVCVKGSSFGASYTLKSGKNFIGRDKNMDVSIPGDKSMSRQCHAIILFDPKSKMFLVQPGTSRELFYLNDKVVLGVEEIESYDVLTVGKTELMFIPCCSERFSWEDQIKKNKETEED